MIAHRVASILRRLVRAWRALLDTAPRTDRAWRIHPADRTPGDWCAHYEPGRPGAGDCDTDGHYLCAGCRQMSAHGVRERGGAA